VGLYPGAIWRRKADGEVVRITGVELSTGDATADWVRWEIPDGITTLRVRVENFLPRYGLVAEDETDPAVD
jgi:hypothetical protein